jgi:uncharacterized membrane protein YdfJ with MMPL/SSD domain
MLAMSKFVLRHKLAVAVFWLVVLVAGGAASAKLDLKVAATAFGAGILLDATIVRGLLVPALVAEFGKWNWWLPAWARWLLRVPAPPATVNATAASANRTVRS